MTEFQKYNFNNKQYTYHTTRLKEIIILMLRGEKGGALQLALIHFLLLIGFAKGQVFLRPKLNI